MKPIVLAAVVPLVLAAPLRARTWEITVDGLGGAPTVQAGIDSAAAGDTVLGGPGTYHEAINFLGKAILVRSQSGPGVTTLDAMGLGARAVTFESSEARNSILEGLRITGGVGGVLIRGAQPSLSGNIVTGNTAIRNGGGILCTPAATRWRTTGPGITGAWQNAGGDGVGTCPTWWQSDGNLVADPAFCDTTGGDFHLAQESPALTHEAGPLDVYPIPGCGPVPVRPTTWGRLKTRYQ